MYTSALFLAAVSIFASGTQAVCDHNTHLFARDAPSQQFTYTGLTGPLNWHSLNTNNTLCAKGTQQTPINLDSSITTVPGSGYVLHYPTTAHAEFENLGTTVEVLGDEIEGTLVFGGKTYNLAQFHFHTPSEHRIEEEFYPMEVHFVHAAAGKSFPYTLHRIHPCISHTIPSHTPSSQQNHSLTISSDGSLAVVGFVIEIGANTDSLLNKVLPFTNQIPKKGDHTEVGPLNFNALKSSLANNPVYR